MCVDRAGAPCSSGRVDEGFSIPRRASPELMRVAARLAPARNPRSAAPSDASGTKAGALNSFVRCVYALFFFFVSGFD